LYPLDVPPALPSDEVTVCSSANTGTAAATNMAAQSARLISLLNVFPRMEAVLLPVSRKIAEYLTINILVIISQ